MDFSGKIVLSFLEEDNVQRAYFRIRPLLTVDGALSKQDVDALPDEGYLRIVPDKNEQHTFKDRMRSLGMLCVLDLKNIPPEVIKIRNNKNYAPARGENNQFIVYSDAVQAVPSQLLYEVIPAEQGDKDRIAQSTTPLCYLRSGGRIYGPVSRATALDQEGAGQLAPDSNGIYSVTFPDGTERLYYWPRREEKAEPRAAVLQSLEQEDAAPSAPEANPRLNGMPLYQTVARRAVPQQRAHNPLIEAVDQQVRAGRVEAPGAVLSVGAAPRQLENPMEAYKRSLSALWPLPEMQRQAVAHMLSMTGVQNILNQQLAGRGTDAVTAAMNSQIQDLEAERLALIMQVDAAKKSLSSLRKEALEQANREESDALRRARLETESARADLEKINADRARLLAERDEAIADMQKAGKPCLAAKMGGYADLNTLIERVQKCICAQGFVCSNDDALHLLTLLCVCDGQLALTGPAPADALALCRALSAAVGTPYAFENSNGLAVQAGGDTLMFVIASAPDTRELPCIRLLTAHDGAKYAASPYPVAHFSASDTWQIGKLPPFPAVRADSLRDAVLRDAAEPPKAALTLMEDICRQLAALNAPVAQSVRGQIYAYLSAASVHMQGGIAKAMDYAVCAYILPHIGAAKVPAAQIRPLLTALPMALAALER